MKALLILAALLVGTAHADEMVYRSQNTTVRLKATDCSQPTLAKVISGTLPGPSRDAVVIHQGREIPACWALIPEVGAVAILDAEGDSGAIPIQRFSNSPAI